MGFVRGKVNERRELLQVSLNTCGGFGTNLVLDWT
jgi:hypothetical protein